MKHNWPKLACLSQTTSTCRLYSFLYVCVLFSRIISCRINLYLLQGLGFVVYGGLKSVVYILYYFVIIESVQRVLKMYMKVPDEAYLSEIGWYDPENLTL